MHREYLPMNVAALMDRVFDIYKTTFLYQFAFSIVISLASSMLLFGAVFVFVIVGVIMYAAFANEAAIIVIVIIGLLILLPLYMAWVYLSSSGHIYISKQAFYKEKLTLPFKETLRALLRVMSVGIAQFILMLPPLIFLAFVFIAASFVADIGWDLGQFFVLHPAFIIIASIIFGLAFVAYLNIFALSVPVAIFEKRLFFSAVIRSFQLLQGDFWRILGLRVLWFFMVLLFSYSAQGLLMLVFGIITFIGGDMYSLIGLWTLTSIFQVYASMAVSLLIAPMEGIMSALIFFNQKIKKDGLDIEISLEHLSKTAVRHG